MFLCHFDVVLRAKKKCLYLLIFKVLINNNKFDQNLRFCNNIFRML
jgi:hypothetical protein